MSNSLFTQRLSAVRAQLPQWKVDGVLISSPSNRRWLSGFTGSNAYLLVTHDKALLATDFRYWGQAAEQAPAFQVYQLKGKLSESIPGFIKAAGVPTIGLEAAHTTLHFYEDILQKAEGITYVKLAQTVEKMRDVKAAEEIAQIRAAAAITDQVMAHVNQLARPGLTEKQLAWELEKRMRELGADGMAFAVTVASGPNGAMAHHKPNGRTLQPGDPIIIDMGAELNGYKSDLTRTFHLGPDPSDQFWQIYNLVHSAQKAALAQMRAGVNGKTIDALARDLITAAGHGDHFGHSLGHGVGLDIHETPRLSYLSDEEIIPAGAVITVEPGVYLPGWGGVRIEDLVLFTETGVELLSQCPKNPIIPLG